MPEDVRMSYESNLSQGEKTRVDAGIVKQLQNLGIDEATLKQKAKESLSKHDTWINSFDIYVPQIPKSSRLLHSVQMKHPHLDFLSWTKFDWKTIKNDTSLLEAYSNLKTNYTHNVSGYDDKNGHDYVWFLESHTLRPGLKKTNDTFVVGIACFGTSSKNEKLLCFCWIHPFLRGYGCMGGLMLEEVIKMGFFRLEPPVSSSMLAAFSKVLRTIMSSPTSFPLYFEGMRKEAKAKWPKCAQIIDSLDSKDLVFFLEYVSALDVINEFESKVSTERGDAFRDAVGRAIINQNEEPLLQFKDIVNLIKNNNPAHLINAKIALDL
jgi:hypothetical protein